ncbi:hypothetical protein CYMTET_36509 [Cymbomonas tetramitiformis]|uniref:Uncharacterized protein n=1 Tax=Cymbomonas tetramitiformis TaxID=36881 RepID=A0AAE0F760_9CHLO|nr:hypothetical protein CYMTET_36509 [Cymbomonas tetramitiformis]
MSRMMRAMPLMLSGSSSQSPLHRKGKSTQAQGRASWAKRTKGSIAQPSEMPLPEAQMEGDRPTLCNEGYPLEAPDCFGECHKSKGSLGPSSTSRQNRVLLSEWLPDRTELVGSSEGGDDLEEGGTWVHGEAEPPSYLYRDDGGQGHGRHHNAENIDAVAAMLPAATSSVDMAIGVAREGQRRRPPASTQRLSWSPAGEPAGQKAHTPFPSPPAPSGSQNGKPTPQAGARFDSRGVPVSDTSAWRERRRCCTGCNGRVLPGTTNLAGE